MNDLIKRADAIKALTEVLYEEPPYLNSMEKCMAFARNTFKDIPSAENKGEWIPCSKSGLPLTELMRQQGQKWYGYKCSNCNHIHKGNALIECRFCSSCGARMKGADDE